MRLVTKESMCKTWQKKESDVFASNFVKKETIVKGPPKQLGSMYPRRIRLEVHKNQWKECFRDAFAVAKQKLDSFLLYHVKGDKWISCLGFKELAPLPSSPPYFEIKVLNRGEWMK